MQVARANGSSSDGDYGKIVTVVLAIPVIAHRDGIADQQIGWGLADQIEADAPAGNIPDLAFYCRAIVDNLAKCQYWGAW